jgi:alpha-glucosidase (family GH31 glycosyl hydrolase)
LLVACTQTWQIPCQFLVGDDILVAPVLDKGQRTRDVYLPDKDSFWRLRGIGPASLFRGGQWINGTEAGLDEVRSR